MVGRDGAGQVREVRLLPGLPRQRRRRSAGPARCGAASRAIRAPPGSPRPRRRRSPSAGCRRRSGSRRCPRRPRRRAGPCARCRTACPSVSPFHQVKTLVRKLIGPPFVAPRPLWRTAGAGVQRRPPRMPTPAEVSYWHETLSGSPGAPPKGGENKFRGRNGRSGGGRPKGADRHAPAEREASCLPEAGARHAGEASGRRRHGPPGHHAGEMRAVLGRPVQVADQPLGRVAASPSPPRARSCPTAPPRPRSSGTRRSPRRR